ncbi:MAG TPA: protein kinase [Polyangiaceae bacterium]|nr:protein kinase [Polyangiaceae bacterium]
MSGVREGEVLAGKYRVDRVLGAGGMGVVVAAHHLELDERVAIKFLLPEVLTQGDAVARFAREARAAVKIKSEHVAKVTDVGKLENGAPYMVMEYLDGSDLSAWLKQRGPLPLEQAVEFVLQACEAIAEAHALGIVHRDLKPSNLFVVRRPDGFLSVKVLDFGISKTTSPLGSGGGGTLTSTSALMGSPFYMSPEQMQSSRDVDSRSDIWALGVLLYELVTGGPPFVADTMPELVLRVVQGGPPPSLRTKLPGAPESFEAAVFRCLERDRSRRYESISELAAALLPFAPRRSRISVERISGVLRAAGLSATALALPPSSDPEEKSPQTATAASWGQTAGPKRRGSWLVAGAVTATLLASAFAWRATRSSAIATPPASVVAAGFAPPGHTEEPVTANVNGVQPVTLRASPVVTPSASPPTVAPALAAQPAVSVASATPAKKTAAPPPSRPVKVVPEARTKPVVAAIPVAANLSAASPPAAPPRALASKPNIFDDRK